MDSEGYPLPLDQGDWENDRPRSNSAPEALFLGFRESPKAPAPHSPLAEREAAPPAAQACGAAAEVPENNQGSGGSQENGVNKNGTQRNTEENVIRGSQKAKNPLNLHGSRRFVSTALPRHQKSQDKGKEVAKRDPLGYLDLSSESSPGEYTKRQKYLFWNDDGG